jgi:cytoskeletal protein CcmA (bactofilin family)
LLGSPSDTFQQAESSTVYYPQANANGPYTVLGPVMLPKIYGKDLNFIEIGSSGSINLSVRDNNALEIDTSVGVSIDEGVTTYDTIDVKVTNSSSNQAIRFVSGTDANKIQLDDVLLSESNIDGNIWNVLDTSNYGILINSPLMINGNLELGDTIVASNIVADSLVVNGNSTLGSNLEVAGTLDVDGVTTLNSNLFVNNEANFASNVYIDGSTFRIPNGPESERPDATVAPYGSIFFNSNTNQFEGLHTDDTWRPFGGVYDTDGDTYISAEFDALDEDTLRFYANSATSNDVRMALTSNLLDIHVDTLLNSNLTVAGDSVFQSTLSVTGVATMSDALNVTGDTTLSSNLTVASNVAIGGTTEMTGDVTMSALLDVTGATTLSSTLAVSDSVTFSSNLTVSSNVDLLSTLNVTSTTTLSSNLSVAGDVQMDSNLNVDNLATIFRLQVTENSWLQGTLQVDDTFTATSNVIVEGPARMSNTLLVQDTATFDSNVIMNNTLSVSDVVTLSSNLTANGPATFTNTVNVDGTVTLNSNLSVTEAVTFSSTLHVTDDTTLSSNLSVVGNTSLSSNLTVQGKTTFNGPVHMESDLHVCGADTLYVDRIATCVGNDTLNMYMGASVDGEYNGTLRLHGNFEVTGTFDTIHATTTDLFVEDKIILLATASNATYGGSNYSVGVDSELNTVSGMQIQGLPEYFQYSNVHNDTTDYSATPSVEASYSNMKTSVYNPVYDDASTHNYDSIWDKSFVWNWNGGMQYGPQSTSEYVKQVYSPALDNLTNIEAIENESFWELKGGAFRITSYVENSLNNKLEKISYSIRITKNKELQFVKHEYNDLGVAFTPQQVATFGVSF